MSDPLVAVTGATGFIGSILLRSLIEKGWKVRALTRRYQSGDEATQWIKGDLDNLAALQALVKGASAVVHCAGQVRGDSLESFVHTNVEGHGIFWIPLSSKIRHPVFSLYLPWPQGNLSFPGTLPVSEWPSNW